MPVAARPAKAIPFGPMGHDNSKTGGEPGRNVSALDVAREAGVSMSAVSRVFTPGASVSAKMRARVLAAAEKLDYVPNVLARSLMTQRTNLVGVILSNFRNPLYLTVLDHFTQQLQQRGLRMILLNISEDDDLDAMARMVMQYRIDGLVVSAGAISPVIAEQCMRRQIPLVAFARRPRSGKMHVVCADNVAGGRMAARRLIEAGHTRFGLITGAKMASTSIERGKGFTDEVKEAGLDVDHVVHATEYSYKAGTEAARQVLSRDDRPEAVFCASDLLAFAVIDYARGKLGLSVPGDLSVIGFDDIELAATDAYNLTTIRQPIEQMVQETLELLTRQMASWTDGWSSRIMACTRVERGTVRAGGATPDQTPPE